MDNALWRAIPIETIMKGFILSKQVLMVLLGFGGPCLGLLGCNDGSNFSADSAPQSRVSQLSEPERRKQVPNDLFAAVLDRKADDVGPILKDTPDMLTGEDSNGNTPLQIAISLGLQNTALQMIESLPVQKLLHRNKQGEGYVFMAASTGQPKIIAALADRYYKSLNSYEPYFFSSVDLDDHFGRNGLFVAADRVVAQELEKEYFRVFHKMTYWSFWLREDVNQQTFLHRAADNGRTDVINWASERICAPSSMETSDASLFGIKWFSNLAYFKNVGIRGFQTYVGDLRWAPFDLIFNRQDKDGNSALHVAAQKRQLSAIRALGSCRWLDFDSENLKKEVPLQTFLKTLNSLKEVSSEQDRQIFDYLVEQQTKSRRFTFTRVDRANWPDADGNTSLHLAALLADPYFYNRLVVFGDVYKKNNQGLTPAVVRQNKDRLVQRNRL